MKCQYCNSMIVPVPANGICPNCGGVLKVAERDAERMVFPEPPVGMYSSSMLDYVIIGEDHIKLYAKYAFNYIIDREIPFDEIYAVKFIPGTFFKEGFLCVRERKDIEKPLPTTRKEAINDVSTIRFDTRCNEKFYFVYSFLKKCADIVNGIE